jgi:ParB/RepB/Spo0J family partition protein
MNFEEFLQEQLEKGNIENFQKTKEFSILKVRKDLSTAAFKQVYDQAKQLGGKYSPAQSTFTFSTATPPPPKLKKNRAKIRATLRLDQLIDSPWNLRELEESDYDIRKLAENIAEEGQHQEIEVRPVGEAAQLLSTSAFPENIQTALQVGKFEVVIGKRRWKALSLAGQTEVDVSVRPDMTDLEACEASLAENEHRKELSDYERGRWFKTLLEKFPQVYPSQNMLAQRFQVDRTVISRMISHYEEIEKLKNQLPPEIVLRGTELPEGVVREIRQAPPELQPKLLEKAVEENLSVRETKTIVDAMTVKDEPIEEIMERERRDAEKRVKAEQAKQDALTKKFVDFYPAEPVEDVVRYLGSVSDAKLERFLKAVFAVAWRRIKGQGIMKEVFQEAESTESEFVEKEQERREETE